MVHVRETTCAGARTSGCLCGIVSLQANRAGVDYEVLTPASGVRQLWSDLCLTKDSVSLLVKLVEPIT